MIAPTETSVAAPVAPRARAADVPTGGEVVTRAIEAVTRAATVKGAVASVLQLLREGQGWDYAAWLRRDPIDGLLKCSLDSGQVADEFREKTRAAQFREGEALSGRAWRAGDLVVVDDFGAVPEFARAPVARQAGVQTAAAVPLLVNGEIVGTLEVYATCRRTLSAAESDALRKVAGQVAGGIARVELARYASMVRNSPINIISADRDLAIQYLNPAAHACLAQLEEFTGVAADQLLGRSLELLHPELRALRARLLDPKQLPHGLRLGVGPETLEMELSPTYDAGGQYLGPMVTWEVITQRLEVEAQIAAARERERAQAATLQAQVDQILAAVRDAAAGDLTVDVPVRGSDAAGQLGEGLAALLAGFRAQVAGIGGHARTLAGASEQLSGINRTLAGSAEQTSAQARIVSNAAAEVSGNITVTASGTEEMGASIREIARNAADAARVARQAVQVADRTKATVARLGESSTEIGKVVKVITAIAQQTNLLALNATIEAARAGDAGKGFAVVANEVKELAKGTSKATEEISRKIEVIQGDTRDAVGEIHEIAGIIEQISGIQTTIAGAVEEQTATTNEMSRNVSEAARSAGAIAENMVGVAEAADATTTSVTQSQDAADQLARLSEQLHGMVGRFRC
ncbi:MAG: GAF domain-containing protein [Gemmatimonadetes bacterium]|nr:GAF domain-containing protein [Gemmatimonadota bacterium]MBK7714936.1 GAF domain-containing protein [Gemmatimonadota bacterium]MBK7924928.1 GAF domain-containing protein [Gemmatimonadota bacterium]